MSGLSTALSTDLVPDRPDTSGAVAAALRDPGWVVVRSATLGTDVLWLRDDRTAFPRAVATRRLPTWTRPELERMVDDDVSPEELVAIARLKRTFPGATYDRVRALAAEEGQGEGGPADALSAPQNANNRTALPQAEMEFE